MDSDGLLATEYMNNYVISKYMNLSYKTLKSHINNWFVKCWMFLKECNIWSKVASQFCGHQAYGDM